MKNENNQYRQDLYNLNITYKRYYNSVINNNFSQLMMLRIWAYRRLSEIWKFYKIDTFSEEDKSYWDTVYYSIL